MIKGLTFKLSDNYIDKSVDNECDYRKEVRIWM